MLARDDHGIKIPLYFTLEISNKEVATLRWAQQCGLNEEVQLSDLITVEMV